MNFEAIIGLEIHVQMKTKSKMFSSSPVTYGAYPNFETTILDFAFPGTMPIVNERAVINGIRVAHALHMTIDNELHFDRKNYFYSDLPKGYQITQNERPIGHDGYLDIKINDEVRRIGVERIHLEEDTCKQLHFNDYTLVDYNRAGIPLAEIVSRPDIRSGLEAQKYVEAIKSIVSFLDVSDGKMEEGSLRCDVNISLRPIGSEKLGRKVEIKNLNSTANIRFAIEYEIARQTELLLKGVQVEQETRRWDEENKRTFLMRKKTDAVDYKYFSEPNIPPIKLSDEFINNAINTMNELADSKIERYMKAGLNEYDASLLIANRDISSYFDEAYKICKNPKALSNWINVDVMAVLNKDEIEIKDFFVSSTNLAKLVNLIEDKVISNKQAREVFERMLRRNEDPNDLVKSMGMTMISDENELISIINEVLDNNAQSISDYKNGKDRALGYLLGQVMKVSKGKANPALCSKLILKEIEKR